MHTEMLLADCEPERLAYWLEYKHARMQDTIKVGRFFTMCQQLLVAALFYNKVKECIETQLTLLKFRAATKVFTHCKKSLRFYCLCMPAS